MSQQAATVPSQSRSGRVTVSQPVMQQILHVLCDTLLSACPTSDDEQDQQTRFTPHLSCGLTFAVGVADRFLGKCTFPPTLGIKLELPLTLTSGAGGSVGLLRGVDHRFSPVERDSAWRAPSTVTTRMGGWEGVAARAERRAQAISTARRQ